MFRWLHGRGVDAAAEMANVPRALRDELERDAPLAPLAMDLVQEARDGTRKLRFHTHDGRAIESVLIPDDKEERDKLTLCVSSQVGCALDCALCATATPGVGRHPQAGESVRQGCRAATRPRARP